MQANALAEACRARAAHVKACVRSEESGGKPPTLHLRRASNPWTVSTDDFWLLRIGTDHAQRPAKGRNVTATTRRNRARRAREHEAREAAWAEGSGATTAGTTTFVPLSVGSRTRGEQSACLRTSYRTTPDEPRS
jgi:hypothetical protein